MEFSPEARLRHAEALLREASSREDVATANKELAICTMLAACRDLAHELGYMPETAVRLTDAMESTIEESRS